MKYQDWLMIGLMLLFIVIMIVAVITLSKDSVLCVANPLNYTQKMNPDFMCECFPRP